MGDLMQGRTVFTEQSLVRRDHTRPVAQGRLQQLLGRVYATHHLDDDVHVLAFDDSEGVIGQQVRRDTRSGFAGVAHGNPDQFEGGTHPSLQIVRGIG